jgi:hypothetical protein
MPCKISQLTFLFKGFPFDDNLSVSHVFLKQNFRAADPAPPLPLPPHWAEQGWGNSGFLNSIAAALVIY